MRVLLAIILQLLGAAVAAANVRAEPQHLGRRQLHPRSTRLAGDYSPFGLSANDRRIAGLYEELGYRLGQCLCQLAAPGTGDVGFDEIFSNEGNRKACAEQIGMVDARDPGARLKALMHAGQELTDQGRRVTDWHFLYGLEQRKCTCKWVRQTFGADAVIADVAAFDRLLEAKQAACRPRARDAVMLQLRVREGELVRQLTVPAKPDDATTEASRQFRRGGRADAAAWRTAGATSVNKPLAAALADEFHRLQRQGLAATAESMVRSAVPWLGSGRSAGNARPGVVAGGRGISKPGGFGRNMGSFRIAPR